VTLICADEDCCYITRPKNKLHNTHALITTSHTSVLQGVAD